ncbi:ATP-dependent DNA helicase Q4 [Diorhabda carinulata]|uniref:ATP-dependent DNA helicase Q4 n=1 Tax=Diorhabda carinulata TaxID=1163345 RepID=UPI0025A09168|nr:ATP-dependent DNA helicase Q4 [Diorhabda carinulata]
MEFLEPEHQKTYEKCKYIVKIWEHKFQKKYKRVPSKLDIKEASREVRNAYRKYFYLKTAILEQSFKGVEGFEDLESENDGEETTIDPTVTNFPDDSIAVNTEHSNNEETTISSTSKDLMNSSVAVNPINEDVWGSHLNIKQYENKVNKEEEKPNLNLNISKKLFCGSKFTKRNPRKSLGPSQKNKTTFEKATLTQPTPSFSSFSSEEALTSLQNDYTESLFMGVSHSVGSLSQPLNVVQTFANANGPKSLKSVDKEWLRRITQVTKTLLEGSDDLRVDNVELTKLDYDSEDVIENSDEEDSYKSIPPLHVAKKRKVDISPGSQKIESKIQNKTDETEDNTPHNVPQPEKIENKLTVENENILVLNQSSTNLAVVNSTYEQTDKTDTIITSKINKSETTTTSNTKTNKKIKSDKEFVNKNKTHVAGKQRAKTSKKNPTPKNFTKATPVSQRRSSRKTKVKSSFQEFSSSEEDAFHTDTDEKDPEYELSAKEKNKSELQDEDEQIPKKNKISKSSKKSNKRTVDTNNLLDEGNDKYDLEFSIKPRIVAPRYDSVKNILKENKILIRGQSSKESNNDETSKHENKIKNKQQLNEEKLLQKISSGSLNDNFIRINIKKKVFVRGKTGMNFSRYKKSQWKKAKALSGPDMDMGGCDGGMLTCFNCGQVGHFAQKCKAGKGDSLLALDAETEEVCPFPTLEEASKMALEGNLNIRKPKLALKEIKHNENDGGGHSSDNEMFEDDFNCEELLTETIKLEEYAKKLDVKMYLDTVTVVEPYYKLNENNEIIDTPDEVFQSLKQFGHSSFRPGQERAIMRILSGKSTLVTLSTGSGKSLCYQLPAYLYSKREPCISLIISPLVSLMDDQIIGIPKFMKAACLHSNQTAVQRKKIMEAISMGELSILLVSPEAVVSGEKQKGFSSFLRKLPPIAFACIDEAHCVSQWSHNFRPSYLMICRVLRQSLGVKTILGLTATATKATQNSIIQHLEIPDGEKGVIKDIPLPDNLQLSVSKDINKDNALLMLLLSDRFKDCNSIIVYCTRRQECERIATFLRTSLKNERPTEEGTKKRKRISVQAEPYHAGLSASRRRAIQNAFMSGELKIVVATVAFGMGINKSDIRAVIHYNMPSSFESYVQEVGRAGRDGLKAQCHVFLDPKGRDENELRRHIHSNSIDRFVIRKLLEKIFIPCSCKGECPKHEVAFSIESTVQALDIPEENISTLLCYLELHENKYIELLSPAYTICKVVSYSGPLQIRKVAKDCPPLAMALALHKNKEGSSPNVLEFPVIDVAAAMGWESGICKHKLKNLEWITVNNQPKRSTINVQFSDLGFRLLAPGNLADEKLDEALENLYTRVVEQERTALRQLNAIHQTFLQVATSSFKHCLLEESDSLIKTKVREYFGMPDPLKLVPEIDYPKVDEEQLVADIHAIISMYRDNNFTGRAIARIFQGIQSPNYPAVIWGRCKFWRSHLDKDFHVIAKISAREIVRLR